MAPAGSYEALAAAIQAGADAVYFGVGKLNMRAASAANFTLDDLGRHRLEDLELTVGVAAEKTEHGRHLDTLEAARVGNNDALDVLDDVAAASHDHMLDGLGKRATDKRRAIGQGDRLGAAQCAHELFAEQLNEQRRGLLIGRCGHTGAPSIFKPYLRVEEIPLSTWVFACRHHTI